MIAPGSRALLSLDPLYRVLRCPACSATHLFQLDEKTRGELRFTAVGIGHRVVVKDRPPSLRRFLRGHRGRRLVDHLSIPLDRTAATFSHGEVVGKRHRIQRALAEWEPRIRVESVAVDPDPDDPEAAIATITYRLVATRTLERVSLNVALTGSSAR